MPTFPAAAGPESFRGLYVPCIARLKQTPGNSTAQWPAWDDTTIRESFEPFRALRSQVVVFLRHLSGPHQAPQ